MSPDAPLDPRAALDTISDQQATLRQRTLIRSSPLLTAWGLAWLMGYGAGWLSIRPDYTMPALLWPFYFGCFAAAAARGEYAASPVGRASATAPPGREASSSAWSS